MDEALALAREKADARPLPRVRDLPCKHPQGDGYFQFARNMIKGGFKHYPAPAKCVDAVQAATQKRFDEGMAYEREIFMNLMFTPECRAMRHLFLAQRAASKIADVPSPKQRLAGSLAAMLHGLDQGVDMVRVHDVAETVQAVALWRALRHSTA